MSAEDHFVKIMITTTRKSNHDRLIVDFKACNETNLETIEVMMSMSQKTISSEIYKIVCKAFNYFIVTTIEITYVPTI